MDSAPIPEDLSMAYWTGEWTDAFPNRILSAATIDRIRPGTYKVVLDAKRYRSTKPMSNPYLSKS